MAKQFNRISCQGELKDGVLVPEVPGWLEAVLSSYTDCKVTVLIERTRTSKSKEQLGYYWGVVLPEIAYDTGHSVDELHEIFKSRYLRARKFWRGANLTIVGSTQNLSLAEMAEFITKVIAEANELGIEVPPPA